MSTGMISMKFHIYAVVQQGLLYLDVHFNENISVQDVASETSLYETGKKTSLLREEALFLPVCTIVCPFAPNDVPRPLLGAAWAYRVFVSVYVGKGEFVY